MSTLTVALLNAAYNSDGARENFAQSVPCELEHYDVVGGELPPLEDVDAAVITGSKASTYWEEDWIDPLREWLSAADEAGTPLFGVCFGHQILADALGGSVADMGEYELGYHEITRCRESPLFAALEDSFVAFTTHHDEVTELPPGSTAIAENEYANQGFRRGHAFGVQFHPEFDRATARRVAEGKDLPDEEIDAALATITDENVDAADRTRRVFENFCAYAEDVSAERADTAADD